MKASKLVKGWIKVAEDAGWTVETTKGSHLRFRPPQGWKDRKGDIQPPVIHASTPSDSRGDLNFRARLRRAGLDL